MMMMWEENASFVLRLENEAWARRVVRSAVPPIDCI